MTPSHLLVIGAMKSGTTTLHHDLGLHPSVWVAEKEFGGLVRYDVLSAEGQQRYLSQWSGAAPHQLCADVAANYAMAPHVTGVPERAATVVPDAKIVYLVRDPIERIISHHFHDFTSGAVGADIDRVVREDPRLLDFTRYASQLYLWRDHYPAESVRVVRFEDFVADRLGQTDQLLQWAGLSSLPSSTELNVVLNAGGTRRSRGALRRVLMSDLYRDKVRARIPAGMRTRLAGAMLPAPPERPRSPALETVRWVLAQLEEEVRELRELTGGAVSWDAEAILERAARRLES